MRKSISLILAQSMQPSFRQKSELHIPIWKFKIDAENKFGNKVIKPLPLRVSWNTSHTSEALLLSNREKSRRQKLLYKVKSENVQYWVI